MKRRWILAVLLVAFLWIVISRLSQVEELRRTLSAGEWQWVALAFASQALHLVVFAGSYQAALKTVGVHSRILDLIPVTIGSIFVNVAAPSGGAAGAALFVDDLRRRGQPPARTAAGVFLQLIADYLAFTIILFFGLVYLFLQHDLQVYEIIAAGILFGLSLGLSGIMLLSLVRPARLHDLLTWFQHRLNGLFGLLRQSAVLAEGWAERNAAEFSDAAGAAAANPGRLARTIGVALAAHLVNILSLWLLFLAFDGRVAFGPLVAGYAMGILFLIVSITPMGIGVVEGIMSLVYTSLGIPATVAATVVLAYRGLTFWLPLVLGFVLLRHSKTFQRDVRNLEQLDADGREKRG